MPQYLGLHKALWERQQSAMRRSQPEALAVAEAAKQVRENLNRRCGPCRACDAHAADCMPARI